MGSRIVSLACLIGHCAVFGFAGDGLNEPRTEAQEKITALCTGTPCAGVAA